MKEIRKYNNVFRGISLVALLFSTMVFLPPERVPAVYLGVAQGTLAVALLLWIWGYVPAELPYYPADPVRKHRMGVLAARVLGGLSCALAVFAVIYVWSIYPSVVWPLRVIFGVQLLLFVAAGLVRLFTDIGWYELDMEMQGEN